MQGFSLESAEIFMAGPFVGLITGIHELQSISPTQFNGHGFLIRDNTKEYTQAQEGPLCHCKVLKCQYGQ